MSSTKLIGCGDGKFRDRLTVEIDLSMQTQDLIKDMVREDYGEFFDPCPLKSKFDGLKIEWKNVNFINPPYNLRDKTSFVNKAILESKKGKICILLIPSATDTELFLKIWEHSHTIFLIHKRVKFKGYNSKGEYVTDKSGQSGSILAVIRQRNSESPEVRILKR